jgi:hypothetical protein
VAAASCGDGSAAGAEVPAAPTAAGADVDAVVGPSPEAWLGVAGAVGITTGIPTTRGRTCTAAGVLCDWPACDWPLSDEFVSLVEFLAPLACLVSVWLESEPACALV